MNTETTQVEQSFEDAIREHLLENRQKLVKSAVNSAIEKLADTIRYSAQDHAHKSMKSFFEQEVAPELEKFFKDNRETLVASMIGVMKQVIDHGMKAQAESWMKKISASDYERAEVIGSLFGVKVSRY
jgi:cation transport regulator ChaB